jgi:crotonobetainyl-CoA:carnitine CoA-transferase CaiB-like acyl-CoA transferase
MTRQAMLEGIRVTDLTTVFFGPYCTQTLADLGADVVKLEPAEGDTSRLIGNPPTTPGMGPVFMRLNRGKRTVDWDLKTESGREAMRRLIEVSDVFIHNIRSDAIERAGLGYESVRKIRPDIVYVHCTGFDESGPYAGLQAYDDIIQAATGLAQLLPMADGNPQPRFMPAAIADKVSGLHAVYGVLAAIIHKLRTGEGQFVDVAMLDSMVGFLSGQVAEYTTTGQHHAQLGNGSVSGKPTADRFRCGDGFLVLAVLTDKQFGNLMRALGREDALRDPRFADWPSRSANKVALREVIEHAMRDGDPASWERRLIDADAPCGQVNSIADVTAHPQLAHREMIQEVSTPYGSVRLAGSAFRMAHGTGGLDRPIALPGEHTDEVLASIGYDPQAIAALRADKVV